MKTTGTVIKASDKSAASPIEARSRLWMLASVSIVFSFAWPVMKALTHTYTFEHSAVGYSSESPIATRNASATGNVSGRDEWRMMSAKGMEHSAHRDRASLAVPVGFHVADLNIPLNSDRVFSYRRIDEFLQHQVRLTDAARTYTKPSGMSAAGQEKNLRHVAVDEQSDDVQIF